MSNGYQDKQVVKSTIPFHFFAGLTSGVFSAVLLQPADLLKTRLQQSASNSLPAIFHEILRTPNPVQFLWRGTVPSALRTGIGSAIYFTTLNNLRGNLIRYRFESSVFKHQAEHLNHSSSLPKLSNIANLATGALARTLAGLILMPMTIIKVRFESDIYKYSSIHAAAGDIFRTEGLKGFLSGVGATTARDAPYAGLYVLFYEDFKRRLSSYSNQALQVSESTIEMNGAVSVSINFSSGILAAGLATALTNPFDAIKTRIQLQPLVYHNISHAFTKMTTEDGLKCLFDGLGLRIARKALSSALAWTLYEEIIRKARLRWN